MNNNMSQRNPNSSFELRSSGLSRPRFIKVRKQASSQNLKPSGNVETLSNSGFNPFRTNMSGEFGFGNGGSENFVFGKTESGFGGNSDFKIAEEMKSLRIGSENGGHEGDHGKSFRFGENVASRLPEHMKSFNIKDSQDDIGKTKAKDSGFSFVFTSGENVGSSIGTRAEDELLNGKLNTRGSGEVDDGGGKLRPDNARNFLFKDYTKSCDSSVESSGHVLQERMKNLNIKDNTQQTKGNVEANEKGAFIFKTSTGSQDYIGENTEKILADEMSRKLNVGHMAGNSSDGKNTGFSFHAASTTGMTAEFSFSSKRDDGGTTFMEFKTPNSKGNPCSGLNNKVQFNAKREAAGETKPRRKNKLKQRAKVELNLRQDFISGENAFSHANAVVSESYSPMDISPYQEVQRSRESSLVSDESFSHDKNYESTASAPAVSNDGLDEELIAATERMDINEGDGVRNKDVPGVHSDKDHEFEGLPEESGSGAETESYKSAAEEMDASTDTFVTAAETEVSSRFKFEGQHNDGQMHVGSPTKSDASSSNFSFTASSLGSQGPLSASKHYNKKKNWVKLGHDSYSSAPNTRVPHPSSSSSSVQFSSFTGVQSFLSPGQICKQNSRSSLCKAGNDSEVDKAQEVKHGSNAAQESCEKWRLRGNHAYTNGDLSKAEECYTQGINSISKIEMSRSCLRALMLCYSNRAATRMSLGRMREALSDCMMASSIDSNFLRVQVRAANCHLALGEVEAASGYFKNCLQLGTDICVDRKIVVEASEGLQKAQKVSECMHQAAGLLEFRTSSDAEKALEVLSDALLICSYSEKLLEMKAKALFMLQKYEEVIKLCEQTFDSAERNSPPLDTNGQLATPAGPAFPRDTSFRTWRCQCIFKSYFHLGKLEDAIGSLEKQEKLLSDAASCGSKTLESSIPLARTVRELLRLKAAGNEAFQAGRHSEAVEHYTAALSCNVESRPFSAVCFCNRAAAYKALGQIVDAIADCSLAIALDGNYLKAISRRATLFEMIRDYGQAANDIQRLVDFLTRQIEEKTNQSGAYDRSMSLGNDLRQARVRLFELEEKARKGIPSDMYLILGVEPSCSASDIRKAYRKAALKHHPDKAGQSLSRNDNSEDRLWKEIGEEVHRDADKLFKMIGEAYAVLSDPAKRQQYDLEEEMRNTQQKRDGSNTTRAYADAQNYYPFERSGSRRNWSEVRRSYGNSAPRWSEATRSNRYPL